MSEDVFLEGSLKIDTHVLNESIKALVVEDEQHRIDLIAQVQNQTASDRLAGKPPQQMADLRHVRVQNFLPVATTQITA